MACCKESDLYHTYNAVVLLQAFWFRTLRVNPLKPGATAGTLQAEKHCSGLPTIPGGRGVAAAGSLHLWRPTVVSCCNEFEQCFTLKPFGFAHSCSIHTSHLARVAAWVKAHYHQYHHEEPEGTTPRSSSQRLPRDGSSPISEVQTLGIHEGTEGRQELL